MSDMCLNIVLNGAFYGAILFFMASGLQIIFGVLGIINFAHAGAYMLGLYVTYAIMKAIAPANPVLLWLAPFGAAVLVGLVGMIFERGILKFIYNRDHAFQILVTLGAAYIIDDAVRYEWGGYPIGMSPMVSSLVKFGNVVYPAYNLVIIGMALALAFLLWVFFQKTNIGRIIRATAHDEEITEALGISVGRVKAGTFFFGSAIAGLAGGLMLPVTGGWPGVGMEYLILSFVVIAVAGLGSVNGALVTALLIGMVNSIGVEFFPKIELATVFILMCVILTLKPSGLFGTPHQKG